MKPKSIGIIGGAGPLAGVFLLEQIIDLSNKKYGYFRDSDFPKIFLISFPFSEMLSPNINPAKLRDELKECLDYLRKNGASVLAIACNTLHAFLDQQDELKDLVHLPRTVAEVVPPFEEPLLLCTSTSSQDGLHRRFFPCTYPDLETQLHLDNIIDQTLKGINKQHILDKLEKLIQAQQAKTVVLGCTGITLSLVSICPFLINSSSTP